MSNQSVKNSRLVWVLLLGIVASLAVAFGVMRHQRVGATYAIPSALKVDGTILREPRVIHSFQLTAGNGQPFTQKNLQGHWSLMFFGFTNCGYVCPTTLAALSKMYNQLKQDLPATQLPHVVMVSVDPERDSAARIQSYVTSFNPAFEGARADLPALKQLSNQMNVVFTKLKSKDGNPKHYMVNHSAEVMLLDPNGNLRAFFSFPHTAQQMIHDYESIMHNLGKSDEI